MSIERRMRDSVGLILQQRIIIGLNFCRVKKIPMFARERFRTTLLYQ